MLQIARLIHSDPPQGASRFTGGPVILCLARTRQLSYGSSEELDGQPVERAQGPAGSVHTIVVGCGAASAQFIQ